ncbi:hypothetical protein QLQ11_01390 [Ochrobactrum sp. SSR]|uniref:hypothetical protein n=1 Tax=Ochrobactrum sp. SSR TaxID=3045176 RepID=UPI0027A49845|nr:hypothetical protein QLQ11_01390 [Ochrobactrum sp. SSR]
MDDVVAAARPGIIGHGDIVDEANQAVAARLDGDQLTDGPVVIGRSGGGAGQSRNDGALAVALDDMTFRAVALYKAAALHLGTAVNIPARVHFANFHKSYLMKLANPG